jgi:hypothetical protein
MPQAVSSGAVSATGVLHAAFQAAPFGVRQFGFFRWLQLVKRMCAAFSHYFPLARLVIGSLAV